MEVTFGGDNAERKRGLIAPNYFEPGEADFEEVLIQINYPEKFVNIQHQHVLGTLMSLGIERNKLVILLSVTVFNLF